MLMKRLSGFVFSCVISTGCFAQPSPQLDLQRIELFAGIHRLEVQVAQTPEQRMIGLMNRTEMASNEGMIFVFEEAKKQCFWMKNTLLALSAAFIDADGSIVNIADMQPQTTQPHCSAKPVSYVLEMHQGWFDKHGLKKGSKLTGVLFTTKVGKPLQ